MKAHLKLRQPIDISVVLPAFRSSGFIDRAINSAPELSGVYLEVVVVEDACPLHTADAVEARYGTRDDLRLIRLPVNQAPGGARNAGFQAARGEWIAVA
ncbi:glycosyltransferase family 2 protein [Nordella sp. HKS 07]|uniref:glycosyltransferase family 2 protein n=1 Tax=Nordella sp. HKS 07 TaxID=2712222 RepID=UPI0013E1B457|nr:glycosyltransferase family 2 protein [Nordella sp. HKS 07]QIG48814.1 glycosyltransferase family 2 protein [Nordella sp. HKS 07]